MNDLLRIGVIAPPWLPVPPVAYGGTELVIDSLCVGLRRAGHDVTLFTTADATCRVTRRSLYDAGDPDLVGTTVRELRHVAAAYDELREIDIIHDHTLAGLFYHEADPTAPVVATNHGPFDEDASDLYRRVAARIPVVAISADQASRAPADVPIAAVIHHGIDLGRYRFAAEAGDHVVFLGRMSPDKGIETAVRATRKAGLRLLIGAKMREPGELRYYRQVIRPLMGDGVEYVGEVDFDSKIDLLSGARALINPIQWPEPFGLVMIEAMACGTPVVGFGAGAAPEIVDNGITGFLASDEAGLAVGLQRIDQIDRGSCRSVVAERFSMDRMAADHIALYQRVLSSTRAGWSSTGPQQAPGSASGQEARHRTVDGRAIGSFKSRPPRRRRGPARPRS